MQRVRRSLRDPLRAARRVGERQQSAYLSRRPFSATTSIPTAFRDLENEHRKESHHVMLLFLLVLLTPREDDLSRKRVLRMLIVSFVGGTFYWSVVV